MKFTEEVKMMSLSKGTYSGLLIMLIAGIMMALLVVFSRPIPTLIPALFAAGSVIAIVSALVNKRKKA